MDVSPAPIPFLDVSTLLESSQPGPRVNWFWYAAGGFLLIVLLSAYASSQSPAMAQAVDIVSGIATVGVIVGLSLVTWSTIRRQRGEMQQVEAIEELVQLRRWPDAAGMLQQLLSSPTRTQQTRIQALIYLSSVLSRYHRFDDAIRVQTYLLEHVQMDEGMTHSLRLGRAMAMLRMDHLFDADRAIAELRRGDARDNSAGLALIEMYRDVKTGHPAEAIEIFQKRLALLRDQLGHRAADAYALVARAHDLLNQPAEAATAFQNATLLAPTGELFRRYPEVATLMERYAPASAPAEAA